MSRQLAEDRSILGLLKIGDWCVIVTVLLGTGALVAIPDGPVTSPVRVSVDCAAGSSRAYSLTARDTLTCPGPLGSTTIEIAPGGARITASPCRHQICVRTAWIRRVGELTACLPNRVVVRLVGGGAPDGRLDAVSR